MFSIGFLLCELDEDYEENVRTCLHKRFLRDRSNVFDIPDNEFNRHFKMNKMTFSRILKEMSPHMMPSQRVTSVPVAIRLATFVRFLVNGCHQKSVGDEKLTLLSESKVCRIIKECLQVFEEHFCSRWIQLKSTEKNENKTKDYFFSKFQIPGVVGCIDSMHIRIKLPKHDVKYLYVNSQGLYTINSMILCDENLVVKYVDARHPGGNDDAKVWKDSAAEAHFKTRFISGNENYCLIGDSAYPLLPYLLTPFATATEKCEVLYNEKHCNALGTIKRCFGIIKNRFRCLTGENGRGLHCTPEKATQLVNVCCALHNACIYYKSYWPSLEEEPEPEHSNDDNFETLPDEYHNELSTYAFDKRRRIAENMS